MKESEIREILDAIHETDKPENLEKAYSERKKAYGNGDCLGLDEMSAIATIMACKSLEYKSGNQRNHKKVEQAVLYLEEVRKALKESRTNREMLFWPQALISTYPVLVLCYIELAEWEKADNILNEYIRHLINLFDRVQIPEPLNVDAVADRLYHIIEIVCSRYRSSGDTKRAINRMLSASRIILKYGDERTQAKFYAYLTKMYRSAGNVRKAEESYKEFEENYKCAVSGGNIPDDITNLYDELDFDQLGLAGATA